MVSYTPKNPYRLIAAALIWVSFACCSQPADATPANKAAFVKYFGRFLPAKLDSCTTCHLPKRTEGEPTSLANFPHNSFGHRLALAAEELRRAGKRTDIPTRLRLVLAEDSDGDGVDNLSEILLAHAPGDAMDSPTAFEIKKLTNLKPAFARYLAEYRWQPFEPVRRPTIPRAAGAPSTLNPIDAFLSEERGRRGLVARQPAPKDVLLRRVYLDLTGLSPTPDEVAAFENDYRPDAYERVVDRLLASPRYGERWGRHWMDVWRYSDWAGWADGNQIRDSKPFIWRWRDWIVESLNADKGYDQMVREMLAADELEPDNPDALRATGYLVRNFKLLSREQWMDDLINHTGRAFLGLTLGCAKCHNHMYDPITQEDYYRVRAVFEPHNVRTDRVPGQPDVSKDGLVHAFDADMKAPTYLFIRGDERNPDKSKIIPPGVPESLGGAINIKLVALPYTAYYPDRRPFVVKETLEAAQKAVADAKSNQKALRDAGHDLQSSMPSKLNQSAVDAAEAELAALSAVLAVEVIENQGDKQTAQWTSAAKEATRLQRAAAVRGAEVSLLRARIAADKLTSTPKLADSKAQAVLLADTKTAQAAAAQADKALTAARDAEAMPLTTAYTPRSTGFPEQSTGRRSAFANWLTDSSNPLTARVAVNQIWMRHFGTGIVPSVDDFGRNGRPPSNPRLLDWLAAELMAQHWRMKPIHRLIVTSRTYRMSSTPDPHDAKIDPDDVYLWHMPSRRMEAELVRDNLLYVAGSLDESMGGPEVDHTLGLTSRRRSIYLRTAAEKQVELLSIFDGPSVTECYARKPSVMPQQALALANSELALNQAGILAERLASKCGTDNGQFVRAAFMAVLSRLPTPAEFSKCIEFMQSGGKAGGLANTPSPNLSPEIGREESVRRARKRMNLMLVLFNHNDFVTIR